MSDPKLLPPDQNAAGEFDHEIDVAAIRKLGIILALTIVAGFVVCIPILRHFAREAAAAAPPPSPFAQQLAARQAPLPHLQVDTTRDVKRLRTAEAQQLTSYGWVAADQATARVPIERAMALLAAQHAAAAAAEPASEVALAEAAGAVDAPPAVASATPPPAAAGENQP